MRACVYVWCFVEGRKRDNFSPEVASFFRRRASLLRYNLAGKGHRGRERRATALIEHSARVTYGLMSPDVCSHVRLLRGFTPLCIRIGSPAREREKEDNGSHVVIGMCWRVVARLTVYLLGSCGASLLALVMREEKRE